MTTAGALLTTILGLTLGQAPQTPNDVFFTNQRNHSVPVNVPAAARAEIRELRLFASRDQGTSWQQVAVIGPDKNAFAFYAPTDGSYWLRVATVNQKNQQQPENLYEGPPNIKMAIDSMKPLIRLGLPTRQGNDVVVSWELQEDHPEWSTFQIEYQAKDAANPFWTKVNANPGLTGNARFTPPTQGPVVVRLQLRDMAGNSQIASAELGGTQAAAAAPIQGGLMSAQFTPSAPSPFPAPPAPMGLTGNEASPSLNGPANATPTPGGSLPLPPAPNAGGLPGAPMVVQTPFVEPKTFPPAAQAEIPPPLSPKANPPLPASQNQPLPPIAQPKPPIAPPAFAEDPLPPRVPNPGPPPGVVEPAEETKIIARTDGPVQTTTNTVSQRQSLPPLMYVNNPEVTLEYELSKVGPSGVAAIELWWTQNDGKTWEMYAYDPNVEAKPGRQQRIVPLPGDGVFGFILIVKSKAGLGRRPPRAGEAPEIRVEVDTTAPVAQLAQPVVDPHRNNSLLLRWAAKDANLTPTPITLEWAEKREGPWSPIATNLGNTGRHSWQLPDRLPVAVYLRLRVKDLGGNESAAVTPEPQNVDLSEPEGRLLNAFVSPRK
ncbi:MAG: hypothetical protein K2X38_04630 [Gemmataceae bacterium]|nr:hypothetical protein [Gemmataceae bacterium]